MADKRYHFMRLCEPLYTNCCCPCSKKSFFHEGCRVLKHLVSPIQRNWLRCIKRKKVSTWHFCRHKTQFIWCSRKDVHGLMSAWIQKPLLPPLWWTTIKNGPAQVVTGLLHCWLFTGCFTWSCGSIRTHDHSLLKTTGFVTWLPPGLFLALDTWRNS